MVETLNVSGRVPNRLESDQSAQGARRRLGGTVGAKNFMKYRVRLRLRACRHIRDHW